MMIVEQRNYSVIPGKVAEYLAIYEAGGARPQRRHLGRSMGYYASETGELNQIVQFWIYEDFEDRRTRRTALFADPEWLAYFDRVIPLILRQESRILTPASFITPVQAEWRVD